MAPLTAAVNIPNMRALIVDDCAEDRLNLRALLDRCRGIEIVGEAASLEGARRMLSGPSSIDLLFLDIQLGRENGFDLLKSLRPRPQIIVTTVHRNYGERAFDLDATDYLVKPLNEDRLQRALCRAEKAAGGKPELERIAVHRGGAPRQLVAVENILAVTGDDKYSRVITGSQEVADHRTLREWEDLLRGKGFTRIDRSTVLRPDRILSVMPFGRGAKLTFSRSSAEIEVGRAGRERLEKIFA